MRERELLFVPIMRDKRRAKNHKKLMKKLRKQRG